MRMLGKIQKTVKINNSSWLCGPALQPLTARLSVHRKVFFTDYGQIPKVERCDMDGQNRTKLVDSKIVFPHGITLDLVSRLVYWADAYLDYIEVVDYEGKNRHTIIQGLLVRGAGTGHLSWRHSGLIYSPFLLWVCVKCCGTLRDERSRAAGHLPFH